MLSLLSGLFSRRGDAFKLIVRMVGVKMGDRFVQVGCPNGARLAAVATGVGLSGRAVAVVQDPASAARAIKGASDAGVLVEIEQAPTTRLSLDDASFDVAVLDDTGGVLSAMSADERAASVRELFRVLRPGGRVMVIGASDRRGLTSFFGGAQTASRFDAAPSLKTGGFKLPRTLAERDGLVFVEAMKAK